MQLLILASGKGSRLNQKKKVPKLFIKINKKSIFDINEQFYNFFSDKIIVSGYKINFVKKKLKNKNYRILNNKNYKVTNMVYSMFLAKKYIKKDLVVVYSDIIFQKKIINVLKKSGSLIPVNKNWLKIWKKRMSLKNLINDAEDLTINNKYVLNIGTKIKTLPKYQYMGILKFSKNDFFNLHKYFKKLNQNKIDMTNFLNEAIHSKVIKLKYYRTTCRWLEIDKNKDLLVAKNEFKKW
jgi:choline kinase